MFTTSDDYHQLNAGAHRNTPKKLHAPALTWHLAFWIPRGSPDQPPNLDETKTKLDNFLLTLCRCLQADATGTVAGVELLPSVSGLLLLFNTIANESFIETQAVPTKRQYDILTSSSRAVTATFKWRELSVAIRCEMHTEYVTITTFAEVEKGRAQQPFSTHQELNRKIDETVSYFQGTNTGAAFVNDLRKYFYGGFWKSYADHVLSYPQVAALRDDAVFQHVFADFRGMIISDETINFSDSAFFDGVKPPSWGIAAKKKLLSLLNVPLAAPRRRQYERTATYMLDGRVLYVSALAPQLPEAPPDERIPVEFVVYAHQRRWRCGTRNTIVNRWQLGRLIHQLNLLGTLRLAALKDAPALHDAGQRLSELDAIVQKARKAVENDDDNAKESKKEAHSKFVELADTFSGAANAKCDLSYRIERSRYYVAQFRANVKLLRIVRLEGDQPYDQFVERRLGAEFDFIDRLGRRYERAANNISMLDQNYTSILTTKIQEYGEFVLLAAPAPYYVSHLLEHIWNDKYMPIITIEIWIGFVAVAFQRRYKRDFMGYFLNFLLLLTAVIVLTSIALPYLVEAIKRSEIDHTEYVHFLEPPSEQVTVLNELLSTQKKLLHAQEEQAKEQVRVRNEMLDAQKEQIGMLKELLEAKRNAPPLRPRRPKRPLSR